MRRFMDPLGITLAFNAVICLLAAGCGTVAGSPEGKGSDGKTTVASTTPTAESGGQVTFALTDAPVQDAQNVYVTIDALEVSLDGQAWKSIPLAKTTEIDLLALHSGLTTNLATTSLLASGTYSQTRLSLSQTKAPRLVTTSGVEYPLQIPGGAETGLKIVTPFTVTAGQPLNLTIDFDLRKSVKRTGPGNKDHAVGNSASTDKTSYMLKPVLRLVDNAATGTIVGTSATGLTACLYPAGAAKDASDDCDQAVNSSPIIDQKFTLAFVPVGAYEIRVFLPDSTAQPVDIATFNVSANTQTAVGAN